MRSIVEVVITLPGASAEPPAWETLVVQLINLWLRSAERFLDDLFGHGRKLAVLLDDDKIWGHHDVLD